MKTPLKILFKILTICILQSFGFLHFAKAQTYQVNGSAVDKGGGLVRMTTQGVGNQTASAWSTSKIDLTQPFDRTFELFFGCDSTANGGDGMTFTLQNDPRGLNATGAGFGFLGIGGNASETIKPALSIEFDTYDGTASGGLNEIPADHMAIDLNGDVNTGQPFLGSSGTTVTVQAVANGRDLESCAQNSNNYYTVRIVWNPTTQTLQLFEEGASSASLTYTNDIINNVFGGSTEVYWGFTGATGSASNEQWIAPEGSIIPWECSAATSCCTAFTVTPTGPSTICNNPITLSVAGSYATYYWSDGSTNPTLEVSAPGTYTLNVQQQQGGNMCPGSTSFTITPTGPTATLSGGTTLCNSSQTTPLSVALTGSAPWTLTYAIDGVNQPSVTNITSSPYVFQANGTHTYTLVSVSDNSGCNSSASGSATVDLYPGIPVGHDDFFTAPGTANLSVDNDGGTYNWYDAPTGGNLVFTGDAFTTPVLNATTTYYVENTNNSAYQTKSAAIASQADGDGANINDQTTALPAAVCFLDFTANSNFLLDTITCAVNATGAGLGQVTVYLTSYTSAGPYTGAETIAKDSININITSPGVQNIIIPINQSCIAGTNYHISYNATGVLQTEMYWQLMQASSFPITSQPELTIQQYGVPNTRYPGLFNWKIRVPSPASSCGRTPVTAYTCPTATMSGDAVICNDGSTSPITVVLTGKPPFSFVYAIDGVNQPITTGVSSTPYTFASLPGAHTYNLISVSNDNCSGTVSGSAHITLNSNSPVGHDAAFSAPGTADLSVDDNGDTYEWYDDPNNGSLLFTGSNFTTPTLNATTTYYVKNASVVNTVYKNAAIANHSDGDGANINDQTTGLPPSVCFLDFTANENFNLDTITCEVNSTGAGTGQITVYITSYTGSGPYTGAEAIVKDSLNISIASAGIQDIIIPLNYACTAGNNYHISYNATGVLQTEMYWQFMQASSFPINTQPELSIQQYGIPNTRYPGLFNWKISTVSTTPTCGRTPVTAYVCPTASISGDAVICNDGNTTTDLTIQMTGDAPWSITYAIDGVAQSAISGITSSPYTITSATGAHVYTLMNVSTLHSNGCSNGSSGTATVSVNPDAPTGHDAYFLPGDAANLSADDGGGIYNWFASATDQTILQTAATYSPLLSTTTTFYVQHVVNGDTSCTRTPVTAYLCPTAVLSGDAAICNDGTSTSNLTVQLSGDSPWSLSYAIDGTTQPLITGIVTNPYTIVSSTGAHTYTLLNVSNAISSGCVNGASGTATVSLKPDLPIGIDSSFVIPHATTLQATGSAGSTFSWYTVPVGGNSIAVGSSFTTPVLTGTTVYYVEQIIGSDTSCGRTAVTAIALQPNVPLFIPNLMTPNHDGKNDQFEIKGLPTGSQLNIYNRWGNAIYQNDNYDNRWEAENISEGVYFYELKLKSGESYKGWLQIIK